jgi:serine/threonine-protein kinase ATR
MSSISETGLWLLDTWLDLRSVQRRWDPLVKSSPSSTITLVLDLLKALVADGKPANGIKEKAGTVLVLLCNEMIMSPDDFVSPESIGADARHTYCLAVVHITKLSIESRVISRLAASKLVNELIPLASEWPAIGPDSDVWVSKHSSFASQSL